MKEDQWADLLKRFLGKNAENLSLEVDRKTIKKLFELGFLENDVSCSGS